MSLVTAASTRVCEEVLGGGTTTSPMGRGSKGGSGANDTSYIEDVLVYLLTGEWVDTSPKRYPGAWHDCNIVWHSMKAVAAISKSDSKSDLVYVYNANNDISNRGSNRWFSLSDPNMQEIQCLEWLEDSDTLLVGCRDGVFVWRNINFSTGSASSSGSHRPCHHHLLHPRGKPVHELTANPGGRSFASLTRGEKKIYVWDSLHSTNTPVYCLDGGLMSAIKWAPSGLHLLATDQIGGLALVDTISWRSDFCGKNLYVGPGLGFENISWLSDFACIFNLKDSRSIYSCNITTDERGASEISNQNSFIPYELEQRLPIFGGMIPQVHPLRTYFQRTLSPLLAPKDLSTELVITKMVSHRSRGGYVAVQFGIKDKPANDERFKVPLIAIYIPRLAPGLSMVLVKIIDKSTVGGGTPPFPLDFKFKYAKDVNGQLGGISSMANSGIANSTNIIAQQATFLSIVWSDSKVTIDKI